MFKRSKTDTITRFQYYQVVHFLINQVSSKQYHLPLGIDISAKYSIWGENLKNKLPKGGSAWHKGKLAGCNTIKSLEMGKWILSGTETLEPSCAAQQTSTFGPGATATAELSITAAAAAAPSSFPFSCILCPALTLWRNMFKHMEKEKHPASLKEKNNAPQKRYYLLLLHLWRTAWGLQAQPQTAEGHWQLMLPTRCLGTSSSCKHSAFLRSCHRRDKRLINISSNRHLITW